ncbi:MAG: hypothetical protein ACLGIR_09810 [Actinomycetes bacterium]
MAAPWDRRDREEQARVLGLVLSRWLPQALQTSPFWAEVARVVGLDATTARDLEALRRLPPVRQADVAGAGGVGGPGLLQRPTQTQVRALTDTSTLLRIAGAIRRDGREGERRALLEEFKPLHVTRGGVGDQLAVASSRSDLDRMHRAGARAAALLGLDDTDALVSAVPAGPRVAWWGVHHLALGASMTALHPRGAGDALEDCVEAFRLVPVTAVAVPVEEAIALADVLGAAGAPVERVDTVLVVGPPPDTATRTDIVAAWRAAGAGEAALRVRALWGPSESRVLWAECTEGVHGLHTFPDLEHLEVLDPLSAAGIAGVADGDLTMTTVGWNGTALLRYRTGAWVDGLDPSPCPGCGRTVPRVVGEVLPEAWFPEVDDGEQWLRLDLRGVAAELARTPGLTTWRAELRPPARDGGADRLVLRLAGTLREDTARDLVARVERGTGVRPAEVSITGDATAVEREAAELGSVFADLR